MNNLVYLALAIATTFAILALVFGPRRAWALWKRFGQALGDILARVVLTVFYFTILVPFALIARSGAGRLELRDRGGPLWRPVAAGSGDLDTARRQF